MDRRTTKKEKKTVGKRTSFPGFSRSDVRRQDPRWPQQLSWEAVSCELDWPQQAIARLANGMLKP